MGLLSSKDKYPAANKIVINPKFYNSGQLEKGTREYLKEMIASKKRSLEVGDEFRVQDAKGEYEVLKITPEPSIPTADTEIVFRNRIVYEDGYSSFNIDEDRLVKVNGEPDLEEPSEIKNPEDFAKVVDSSSALIEYYPEVNVYVFGDSYYYKFE